MGSSLKELKHLGITVHTDGSVTRSTDGDFADVAAEPDSSRGVACKEVLIDRENNLAARMYLTQNPGEMLPPKLPICMFFHGGCFVAWRSSTACVHRFCMSFAENPVVPCVLLSFDYRLAPEHRLPAAFEDGFSALKWLQAQALASDPAAKEPWLASYGDFSRCFLLGHSSGATIAYHVALRAAREDVSPLRIRALVLGVPFVGGKLRTPSELEFANNEDFSLSDSDTCWELALPEGTDRDNPYCNPMVGGGGGVRSLSMPPCMVAVLEEDILYDRQVMWAKAMEEEEDKEGGGGMRVELEDSSGIGGGSHHDFTYPWVEFIMMACETFSNFLSPCLS